MMDTSNRDTQYHGAAFNALTEQWAQQVWRAAQRIPSLCIPNTAQGLVGLYDATPGWIPIYDKSSLPGYYMAIGTSGTVLA